MVNSKQFLHFWSGPFDPMSIFDLPEGVCVCAYNCTVRPYSLLYNLEHVLSLFSDEFTPWTGYNSVFLFWCFSHSIPSSRPEQRPSTESPQHAWDHGCTVTQVHRSADKGGFLREPRAAVRNHLGTFRAADFCLAEQTLLTQSWRCWIATRKKSIKQNFHILESIGISCKKISKFMPWPILRPEFTAVENKQSYHHVTLQAFVDMRPENIRLPIQVRGSKNREDF